MSDPASLVRPSDAVWRGLALKAAGAHERLATRTDDGLAVDALPPRRIDVPSAWRRRNNERDGWSVAQRVDDPDADRANACALEDLEGGADALTLVFAGGASARGHGIASGDLDAVLSGVEIDLIALRLDPGTPDTIAALAGLVQRRRLASAGLLVDCGFDPIGTRARRGGRSMSVDDLARALDIAGKAGLAGQVLMADGRPYHEAGAGAAQELAAVLASGVAYLRHLTAIGLSPADASATIAFCLAVDADAFEGLAKVRAMRRLWARVEQAAGVPVRPIRLHAETAWRSMARRDPWTNVMRATTGTIAAGLGGADCVTVLPHTLPLGLPDAAARRLARNVGRVLIDEAELGFVEDPAAGAGGPEALTEALCERAWALFQDIEREGGVEASLAAGLLQARIATVTAGRADDVAHARRGVVGVNLFPSLAAGDIHVLAPAPPEPSGAPDALPSRRDAAPFEALRDAAERLARPPTVFLATLGPPDAFGPRATTAANALAAGGMEAAVPTERRDADALVQGFAASGALVACLCGSDASYAAEAAPLARALKAAGARRVILAGEPGADTAAEWRLAGVDAFLHAGCALLALLEDALGACPDEAPRARRDDATPGDMMPGDTTTEPDRA